MDARHPLAVVTPTLDGDVLHHLALTGAALTPGQLARLLPKASIEGTRKVLNRLAKQGIVLSTRVGDAATTYELNRDHLAADAVIALAQQARTLRERIETFIADWKVLPVYAALSVPGHARARRSTPMSTCSSCGPARLTTPSGRHSSSRCSRGLAMDRQRHTPVRRRRVGPAPAQHRTDPPVHPQRRDPTVR